MTDLRLCAFRTPPKAVHAPFGAPFQVLSGGSETAVRPPGAPSGARAQGAPRLGTPSRCFRLTHERIVVVRHGIGSFGKKGGRGQKFGLPPAPLLL